MRAPVRIALVVVGLAAIVCGTASLTGGWLGTPPWWREERHAAEMTVFGTTHRMALDQDRPGREWMSCGVMAAGIGLVAPGGGPRRRRSPAS